MENLQNTSLKGRYFPAGGSGSFEAELRQSNDQLSVVRLVGEDEIQVEFLELGDRLGNVPRKVLFKDESVFECADNDAVDAFFGRENHFASSLSRLELSPKFVVVAVIATFAVLFGFYRFGLPVAAQFAAWATPTSVVKLIDATALDTVDRVIFGASKMDEEKQAEYTALFNDIVSASSLKSENVRLLFRDGGRMGANAVALPGGTIILTDQLAELSESDDEIAGVLAHELGHVDGRHSLRQIYRAAGIAFMVALVLGDTSQLLDNVIAQVAVLDTLSYSRSFETESDATSVAIMQKLGRDPVAFVDLLDRIYEKAGVESSDAGWLSTHPGNDTRREDVKKLLEKAE